MAGTMSNISAEIITAALDDDGQLTATGLNLKPRDVQGTGFSKDAPSMQL
jgi:hypothetical protein